MEEAKSTPHAILIRKPTFRIVVKRIAKPVQSDDAWDEFEWLCQSLGFLEPIDKDKTAFSVLKEIVSASEKGEALTSTAIAERVQMSRGAVINHLNNLLRSGLIIRHGRFYVSRSRSMQSTIEEIEEDVERIFLKMKKAAKEIDKELGLIEE
jgi:predicted transcriptional regulator